MSNTTIDSDTQKKLEEAQAAGAIPGGFQRPAASTRSPQDDQRAMAQAVLTEFHRAAFLAALSGICARGGNVTASDSNLAANEANAKANAAVKRFFAAEDLLSESKERELVEKRAQLGVPRQ